jgi:hypothetical protein
MFFRGATSPPRYCDGLNMTTKRIVVRSNFLLL